MQYIKSYYFHIIFIFISPFCSHFGAPRASQEGQESPKVTKSVPKVAKMEPKRKPESLQNAPKTHAENDARENLEISPFSSAAGSLRPSKFMLLLKEFNNFLQIYFSPREGLRARKSHQNELQNSSKSMPGAMKNIVRKKTLKKDKNEPKKLPKWFQNRHKST